MRQFVIISGAHTAPIIKDLKAAGRMDVLFHSIISSLFASHDFRQDSKLHLILTGPPTPTRHITIEYHKDNTISKKNLKKLVELCLRRCKKGEVREVHPGVKVDDKTSEEVIGELSKESEVFVLDALGENIKDLGKRIGNSVFVLGDHDGFDKQTRKFLKKNCTRLSLGPQIYFTSQAITIINYEIDNL